MPEANFCQPEQLPQLPPNSAVDCPAIRHETDRLSAEFCEKEKDHWD
jgi:hypothetical protein